MLFSQPEVASFLSDSFECAWESVRPVPRVTIDFGNGHTLERTLRGNIATYVCTSDGRTFDLIAGLVDGPEYISRLKQSLTLHDFISSGKPREASLEDSLARWHRATPPVVREELRRPEGNMNFSKNSIERPIERSLSPLFASTEASNGSVLDLNGSGLRFAASKIRVESPLVNGLRPALDESGLARDTLFAREEGYRLAHAFLATRVLQPPSEMYRDAYRELLHVDLDDPYLGLAPDVLGGEPGRH